MQAYTGEIRMFAGSFAPQGWAFCDGQLLSATQYTALFNVIGYTYGGNGLGAFALPDLRGRFPMHQGQGPNLTFRVLGESSGSERVTLLPGQMPAHNHLLNAASTAANQPSPQGNYLAVTTNPAEGITYDTYGTTPNTTMNVAAIAAAGNNLPHENMPPYQCLSFIICLSGI